uniref:Uncharacterized protein n=1 Tax=Trichogramma kaykai TaxID=54128 RepID=A0ABD2WFQ8_9HYME
MVFTVRTKMRLSFEYLIFQRSPPRLNLLRIVKYSYYYHRRLYRPSMKGDFGKSAGRGPLAGACGENS